MHTAFGTVSEEAAQNAIICTAPSKTFNIAGLQNSNILIPNPRIRRAFQEELDSFGYDQLNVMGLAACRAAYEGSREWLDTVNEYIRENLDFTRTYLSENLPKMKLIEPEAPTSSGSTPRLMAFPMKIWSTKSSMTATCGWTWGTSSEKKGKASSASISPAPGKRWSRDFAS